MGSYSFTLGKIAKRSKGIGKETERSIKNLKKVDPNDEEGSILTNKIEDMGKRSEGGSKAIKKDVDDAGSEWMKSTPDSEVKDILGAPKADKEGVVMHRKKGGALGVGAAKRGFGAVRRK